MSCVPMACTQMLIIWQGSSFGRWLCKNLALCTCIHFHLKMQLFIRKLAFRPHLHVSGKNGDRKRSPGWKFCKTHFSCFRVDSENGTFWKPWHHIIGSRLPRPSAAPRINLKCKMVQNFVCHDPQSTFSEALITYWLFDGELISSTTTPSVQPNKSAWLFAFRSFRFLSWLWHLKKAFRCKFFENLFREHRQRKRAETSPLVLLRNVHAPSAALAFSNSFSVFMCLGENGYKTLCLDRNFLENIGKKPLFTGKRVCVDGALIIPSGKKIFPK